MEMRGITANKNMLRGSQGALTPAIFNQIRKRLQSDAAFRRRFSVQPAESLKEFGIQLSPQEARMAVGRSLEQLSRSIDVDIYRRMTRGSVTPGRTREEKPEAEMSGPSKLLGTAKIRGISDTPEMAKTADTSILADDTAPVRLAVSGTTPSFAFSAFDPVVLPQRNRARALLLVAREIAYLHDELEGAVQIVEKVLIDRRWASRTIPTLFGELSAMDEAVERARDVLQKVRATKAPRVARTNGRHGG